jgi:hypothetical protein
MKIVPFSSSPVSDSNHGNVHFLRASSPSCRGAAAR